MGSDMEHMYELVVDTNALIIAKNIMYMKKIFDKKKLRNQKHYRKVFGRVMRSLGNDKDNLYNLDNRIEEFFGWYYVNVIKNKCDIGFEKDRLKEIMDLFFKLVNWYEINYYLIECRSNDISKEDMLSLLSNGQKRLLLPRFSENAIIHLDNGTNLVFELKHNGRIRYVRVIGNDFDTSIFYNIKERKYLFLDDAIDIMLDKKIVNTGNLDVKNRLREIDDYNISIYARDSFINLVSFKLFSLGSYNYDHSFFRSLSFIFEFGYNRDNVYDLINYAKSYLSLDTLKWIKQNVLLNEKLIYDIDNVILEKKQKIEKEELGKRLIRDLKVIRDRKLEEKEEK